MPSSSRSASRNKNKKSRSKSKGRSRSRDGYNAASPRRRDYERPPKNNKLFITNIDSKFSSEEVRKDLEEVFAVFGNIKETVIKTKQGSANSFAFVEFEELEDAVRALEAMKGKEFKGKELKVEYGKGERKQEDRKSDKCYICHKEGHFAKECRSSRYDEERRDHRRRSRSRSSSSSRSYRRRHRRERDSDREDRKRRDSRGSRTPDRKGGYNSRRY